MLDLVGPCSDGRHHSLWPTLVLALAIAHRSVARRLILTMHCEPEEQVMTEFKKPEMRSLIIDARALDGILVDADAGTMRGMKRAQAGFHRVLQEITDNQRNVGPEVGVLQSQVDELNQLTEQIALVDNYLPAAQKLVEMMLETQALLDHRRHEIISAVAKVVDAQSAALKKDELRAHYQHTRSYRSAIAKKGVKTRQKNAAAVTPQSDPAE